MSARTSTPKLARSLHAYEHAQALRIAREAGLRRVDEHVPHRELLRRISLRVV